MNKTLFITALSFVLLSCSAPVNEGSETEQHNHVQEEAEALRLNGAEKWQVNEEMKPFILEAERLLGEFVEQESEDYAALAASLKAENEKLMRSCTMEGESHNQLHLWLYPNMKLVKSLSETEDLSIAKQTVINLQASYALFHQYFQ